MMRRTLGGVLAALLLGMTVGCANSKTHSNTYYGSGSVHSNSWPGTYGRGGNVYVGRPPVYRY